MTVERPTPRSYARTYARVAPNSSSTVFEEGATATRRWTRDEMRARMAGAPPFGHPSPDESLLRELIAGYEHITGDAVRLLGKVSRPNSSINECSHNNFPSDVNAAKIP